MRSDRFTAVAALAGAGLLWGTSVPLTKLALEWLPPAWLTAARFGLAAAVLLAVAGPRARQAFTPAMLAWGAAGYGGSILVQNAGIARTSVSHAALLVGATPVLVAVGAAVRHRAAAPPVAWAGYAASFAGVALVAAGGGAGATRAGDALVLASLAFSASFTVAQPRLLRGRDPVAVTAVQFVGAALIALPVAAVTEGPPATPAGVATVAATAGLTLAGTLVPSTLFAYGQARVSAEVAGAFVNLEPLVGATAGALAFGDPLGLAQAAGGAAILGGIALSSLPLLRAGLSDHLEVERRRPQGAHQPQPDRQHHLGGARGAEVAEVDHVPPAEGLGEELGDLRLGLVVVAAHEHGVVAFGELTGVGHQQGVHGVEGLDHPEVGEGALDALAEGVGVGDQQRGGHALGEVEGVGQVDQDLAVEVGLAGQPQGVNAGRSGGGVDEQLAMGGRVGEAAHLHVSVLGVPGRERRVAVAVRLLTGQGGRRVPGADHHLVPRLGQLGREDLADHARAKNTDPHTAPFPCVE
jgi:O-acetylserine/cysteine efflux transporter